MAFSLAKFFDPGNIYGIQGNPYEGTTTGAMYEFDPTAFQMGTAGRDAYGAMAGGFQNRTLDPQLEALLRTQATGTAPSAAQAMFQSSLGQNMAAASSLAASNPNISPALAQRQALLAQSQMGLQSQGQYAALRAQEQAQGQAALANYMIQQQAQNDQMVRYFQSLGYTADEAQMKARMALEAAKYQSYERVQDRQFTASTAAAGYEAAQQGAVTGAAGAIFGGLFGAKGGGGGRGGGGGGPQFQPAQPVDYGVYV